MKKKYVPVELEIVMAEVCDVITSSTILPEPEEPEIPAPDVGGGTSGNGSGIGGGWNDAGWI